MRQFWDDFFRYVYLPRLRDSNVFLSAISSGVSSLTWESETFVYAEGKEEATGR